MSFSDWFPTTPGSQGEVIDLRAPGATLDIIDKYETTAPYVLRELVGQMWDQGAQTAVLEYRYLDPDYRDEHSRFYSTTFRRYPSVAHRLHFFRDAPPESVSDPVEFMSVEGLEYLGYIVLRPLPAARVGRTMIAPAPEIAPYVSCVGRDDVNIFGVTKSVCAAPFMAQDAQLGRCAHMTAWVTAYHHHLRFGGVRALPSDIADAVPVEVGHSRPVPSQGLLIEQMSEVARQLGLPPAVYRLRKKSLKGQNVFRIACRYLNSGFPVTVAGGGHAFVLVGYRRVRQDDGRTVIQFIRQDDEMGPYQIVEDPQEDQYRPWQWLVVPLPKKVYLTGEEAELLGDERLRSALRRSSDPASAEILKGLPEDGESNTAITIRSTVMRSNDFKLGLVDRGFPPEVAALYQRMQMSRWVWVVEYALREERDSGDDCVIAEVLIDATDHQRDLHCLAWRVPGALWSWLPDEDLTGKAEIGPVGLVRSVARLESELWEVSQPCV